MPSAGRHSENCIDRRCDAGRICACAMQRPFALQDRKEDAMKSHRRRFLAVLCAAAMAASAAAGETPKRGGILTFMIPADAPPSFDAHRETTYATVHAAAPFYSVLIRINPDNPSSTTDFVCDLCTQMPMPTDGGRTYTFKIRQDVKFHDGTPLTAY